MCLILFSWKQHPKYDLIVAANRDEFHSRPTAAAHEWSDHPDLIAGKDLKQGGTWIGLTKCRRLAALTNYRDFDKMDEKAPSRGHLTLDFLTGNSSPETYIEQIKATSAQYNPFNLLVGDADSLWYHNNVNGESKALVPGVYGLSNGLLDDPWPKVLRGKVTFSMEANKTDPQTDRFLEILDNRILAPDEELPKTGIPYGMEKGLSPMFIDIDRYGTRCSTVILSNPTASHFVEKTHPNPTQEEGLVSFSF